MIISKPHIQGAKKFSVKVLFKGQAVRVISKLIVSTPPPPPNKKKELIAIIYLYINDMLYIT